MQVKEYKPLIVAFCCNWCSYAGADLAGSSRLQYPADVKIIRVPCSCRVNPMFILRALELFPKEPKLLEWVISTYETHPDSPFGENEMSAFKLAVKKTNQEETL